MDVLAALGQIGLLTALGWWIDLALDDSQERRLRRRLDDWWVRFDEITWFNFGQQEGRAALAMFDRVFGASFWSWRRWSSVALTLLAIELLTLTLFAIELHRVDGWGRLNQLELKWFYFRLWLARLVVQAVVLSLSLSLTRWASERVVELSRRFGIGGFAGLLALGLLLLAVWGPFLEIVKPALWNDALRSRLIPGALTNLAARFSFDHVINHLVPWIVIPNFIADAAKRPDVEGMVAILHIAASRIPDFFAGAIRIAFSGFFVTCFLLRRFVHRPLAKLGFIWLTSGKPVFAALFGAVASAVVMAQEIISRLSYVPFAGP
jgi:hypothetical protein